MTEDSRPDWLKKAVDQGNTGNYKNEDGKADFSTYNAGLTMPASIGFECQIGAPRALGTCGTVSRLPTDSAAREEVPICTGVFDYFPDAIAEIAKLSFAATKQHHPDAGMHWARDKSTNHADKILRHQMERQGVDKDGQLHMAKVAWRALAQLQEHLEFTRGLPPSPASRGPRTWEGLQKQ